MNKKELWILINDKDREALTWVLLVYNPKIKNPYLHNFTFIGSFATKEIAIECFNSDLKRKNSILCVER